MKRINYPYIEDYINKLYPDHEARIRDIEIFAEENHVPIMERSSLELLKSIIKVKKPKRILELGTAIGYSAIIMALSCDQAEIITIDRNEKWLNIARENIRSFSLDDRISLIFGDINDKLDELEGKFDLILFDAGKSHYREYFDKSLAYLDEGSIIFSDNVLFKGLTANDDLVDRRNRTITRNMRDYLAFITTSQGIHTSVLPVGDGVAISLIEEVDKWKE